MTVRVLQIFNQYRSAFNGEQHVVFRTADLIERHGGQCRNVLRSSQEIRGWRAKWAAFAGGIYNPFAARRVLDVVKEFRPDVVHVHNLYPLFSPSVVVACRKAGIPVVMTLHNQSLTCPRADHLCRGALCDRCLGGREYHCVFRNCRGNWLESVAYAARSAVARRFGWFRNHITLFIALTEFARQRLIQAGYDGERIVVLRNMAPAPRDRRDPSSGTFVGFAGRLSSEKGVDTLIAAADELRELPFEIAGGGPLFESYWKQTPANVRLLGQLSRNDLNAFYDRARMLVIPSLTYEMGPLVIGEAMSHSLPVIASRIGGLPELVRDQGTGLLFEPGNPLDLAKKIRQLWRDTALCRRLGAAARESAEREFGEGPYAARLMGIYRRAMEMAGKPVRDRASDPVAGMSDSDQVLEEAGVS